MTCLLEGSDSHVTVYDIVHERDGTQWNLKVSGYRKLRLASHAVASVLRQHGLNVQVAPGPRGMVSVAAAVTP